MKEKRKKDKLDYSAVITVERMKTPRARRNGRVLKGSCIKPKRIK